MEYVPGCTVEALLAQRRTHGEPVPAGIALFVAAEVAAGLRYAHEATSGEGQPLEIVHRDVSPSNVLLSTAGEVKLTDFGIAKARHRLTVTTQRVVKGKVAYMAPEQANLEPVTPAVDQYALGCVLFEMLTGERLLRQQPAPPGNGTAGNPAAPPVGRQ